MNHGARTPFEPDDTHSLTRQHEAAHDAATVADGGDTPIGRDGRDGRDGRGTVLVLGASGYVGGRLVPELVRGGWSVRCMTRSPERLREVPWASDVEIVAGDLDDPSTLHAAFAGARQLVYLVHSLGDEDFETAERTAAQHARLAAERAGVQHIVYLGGLGDESTELSPHLRSRHTVGRELAAGATPVTELRAAIVIGAGSASFEMMRSLVEVLPVMVTPRWVSSTLVQPIAIADVLAWLVDGLARDLCDTDRHAGGSHDVFEIGGPDIVTYRELMDLYAEVAGLARRWVLSVPVLTPRLSSHWVNLVTPLPAQLSRSLIGSLSNDVVVTTGQAGLAGLADLAGLAGRRRPLSMRAAIEMSIAALDDLDIPTRWSGSTPRLASAQPRPWDADWSGGTVVEDRRERTTDASAATLMRTVKGIGGARGWYGFGFLWSIRGVIDSLVGGVGLRRGRRHPDEIHVGEALDFWRVEHADDRLFRLRAEMRLPGMAWLEWEILDEPDGEQTGTQHDERVQRRMIQRARYAPAGLLGRMYWWLLVPFHLVIFPLMLRRIVSAAEAAEASAAVAPATFRSPTLG
ncbi:MAG: SDR family oxidoreductase [Ilumatobacter sp.]|uniref:SDR family oxidoreductase n=1 Tax=Ilumatobacter sp. TaxID=1967498 RepID=UPI00391B5545